MAMLDNVKTLLEIEDNTEDNLINLYIDRSTTFAKEYCNLETIPKGLESVIEDMAILKYRLKGVEGIVSEGKGSLSESYIKGLPPEIIQSLNKYRRIRFR